MTGLYSFYSGEVLQYVGQSDDVFRRAHEHFQQGRFKSCHFSAQNIMPSLYGFNFSAAEIKRILDYKEACAIRNLNPAENKVRPSNEAILRMFRKTPIEFQRKLLETLPSITN